MNVSYTVLVLALGLALAPLAGAAPLPASVTGDQAFLDWYDGLVATLAKDKKYTRIPLDSDAKANEFVVKLHNLYLGKTSEDEFFIWVDLTYPGHDYDQLAIVNYYHEHRPKKKK